ncbi:MAG TPA: hypothetical protein VK624_09690 [Steroidobacteraceae bacterium]|nr:hypothetical protein [Steroidobacteraceae bacterium]
MLLGGCTSAPLREPQDRAPLPEGFQSEGTSFVPGLYAHGVQFEDEDDLQQSVSAARNACIARGRNLEYSADARKVSNSQYWLYRTGNETVLFVTRVRVHIDIELCRAIVNEKREVTRSVEKAGAWPSPFLGRRSCSVFSKKCYTATKFGIKERCRAEGNGFQVTRHCVSIERGPSRGLLLESVYESDDMSGYGFSVTDLEGNVALDESLFDQSRTW